MCARNALLMKEWIRLKVRKIGFNVQPVSGNKFSAHRTRCEERGKANKRHEGSTGIYSSSFVTRGAGCRMIHNRAQSSSPHGRFLLSPTLHPTCKFHFIPLLIYDFMTHTLVSFASRRRPELGIISVYFYVIFM
jgi:hypothetical protein